MFQDVYKDRLLERAEYNTIIPGKIDWKIRMWKPPNDSIKLTQYFSLWQKTALSDFITRPPAN